MYYGAILAGGSGSRFGSKIPKQFLMLGDKPIFLYSVIQFLNQPEIDTVYIGVHEDYLDLANQMVRSLLGERSSRVIALTGGEDRESTLMNIIKRIEQDHTLTEEDVIVTHDSVRPFVTERNLRDIIAKMEHCDACNTLVPPVDTISQSLDGQIIDNVPDRKTMFCGQSPQAFRIHKLMRAFESLTPDERASLTETARVCFLRGIPVHFVAGDPHNFKITTDYDYQVAKFLLDFLKKKDILAK